MSSRGGYAAAPQPQPPPPRQSGDRFYNPPAVRRHHPQLILQQQQQQQQMLQRQLLQQQQQHLLQRRVALAPARETSSEAEAGVEARSDADASSTAAALSVPPSIGRGPTLDVTNLDRLMESVTPFVEARCSLEVNARGRRAREVDSLPFYYLEDLWDFFSEWSYYGAGVPLLLNGKDRIEQYYVPFLSGIQLYVDPSNPSSRLGGPNKEITAGSCDLKRDTRANSMQGLNMLSLGNTSVITSAGPEVAHARGPPSFQFLEYEPPYNRRPLADKISSLVLQYPELSKCKSCDLLPSSWICVAWYPIYRIPIGPTLQDLDANVRGFADSNPKISLPVFALTSYKLKGSIVSPSGPHECDQENSLLQAADKWLNSLEVMLPDYQFFRAHYSHRR
ncbi:Protein of unknown function (DUF789 [Striga hermonthica]|uniref:Uncharacterized protein n=1 Tax=Striga hermonthica TaxID=68872 RepID=A0A9N7RIA9_STRHE|nr:Protein of unknown function (DUF789 [Striga hermonthica]